MATRQYDFIVGPTTSELPSLGTPTGTSDLISLGYADENYVQGGSAKAAISDLKAVTAANRSDNDLRYVDSKDALYFFDASATGTNDDDLVLEPSAGTGRWRKMLFGLTSNVLGSTDTQNVSGKSVSGSLLYDDVYFKSSTGTNRKFGLSVSGATNTTQTTFFFTQTADRSITFQDSTHVVVGRDTTDTLSSKTLDAALATTSMTFNAQAELRMADSDSSNYVGFKAPATVAANKVWTLPDADGSANQVLSTDGSLLLSWQSAATSALNANNVEVGNASNVRTATPSNLLGDIKGSTASATITVTIATPGVVSHTSHGMLTGDRVYFTNSGGALPTGITASTTYYVIKIDANSYNIATTLLNALIGTKITTSGSQSGTHTAFTGGLKFNQPSLFSNWLAWTPTGTWNNGNVTYTGLFKRTGDVGEYLVKVALSGAPNAATVLIMDMPPNQTIDTSKMLITASDSANFIHGYWVRLYDTSAGNSYYSDLKYVNTTTVRLQYYANNAATSTPLTISNDITATTPFTFATGDYIYMYWKAPILEWAF